MKNPELAIKCWNEIVDLGWAKIGAINPTDKRWGDLQKIRDLANEATEYFDELVCDGNILSDFETGIKYRYTCIDGKEIYEIIK